MTDRAHLTIPGLSAVMALCGVPVVAQDEPPFCTKTTADMVSVLGDQWQERQVGIGLDHRGVAVMIFLSPGETWTITYTAGDGTTCIVAAGTGMMIADPAAVFETDKGEEP